MKRLKEDPIRYAVYLERRKLAPKKKSKPMTAEQRKRYLAYQAGYRQSHPLSESTKEKRRIRYRILCKDPIWRSKEKTRQRAVKRDEENRAAYKSKFRLTHPNYKNDWRNRRRKTDPAFLARCRITSRMHAALRGNPKSDRTLNLLGCTPEELRRHIESLFLAGMTWENRHLWHIDHIRPCASFDLTDPDQQRCCFHFSNLQPLWAKDNLLKRDKLGGSNV